VLHPYPILSPSRGKEQDKADRLLMNLNSDNLGKTVAAQLLKQGEQESAVT
jgi:hypothetical protein